MKIAQIHRSGAKVAISLPNGETVYLTAGDATRISNALRAAAVDVEKRSFINSEFSTVEIPLNK
jgi:hypothetical protein